MSDPQQSALADLARADFEQALRELEVTVYVYGQRTDEEAVRRLDAARDRVLALWQAPPRPDAAAFEQAIDKYRRAVIHEEDVRESTTDPHRQRSARLDTFAARAALLAFAPSADAATITEKDVYAGARALWERQSSRPFESCGVPYVYEATVLAILNAVAAARQRATGSGVRE